MYNLYNSYFVFLGFFVIFVILGFLDFHIYLYYTCRWRTCDVGQVPGSLWGRICDVEQVPGSFQGRINDVARICYAKRVPDLLLGRLSTLQARCGGLLGSEKHAFSCMKRSSCTAPRHPKALRSRGPKILYIYI